MCASKKNKIKRLNRDIHRDFGYFFSSLIIVYCISGIALNHVNDWNPDFIIKREIISISKSYSKKEIDETTIKDFGKLVNEKQYKIYDFPTTDQVKIYYNNASFHLNFKTLEGVYERIYKKPLFYQTNVLHRNSLEGWKWLSDIFALMLIIINVTGLFISKGKYGISGRGKWLIIAGFIPPLIAIIIQQLMN